MFFWLLLIAQIGPLESLEMVTARTVYASASSNEQVLFTTLSTGMPARYEVWLWNKSSNGIQRIDPNFVWSGDIAYVVALPDGDFGILVATGKQYYILSNKTISSRPLALNENRVIEAVSPITNAMDWPVLPSLHTVLVSLKMNQKAGAARQSALFDFHTGEFHILHREALGIEQWIWFMIEEDLYRAELLSGSIDKVTYTQGKPLFQPVISPQILIEDPRLKRRARLFSSLGEHISAHRNRLESLILNNKTAQFFAPQHLNADAELVDLRDALFPVAVFNGTNTRLTNHLELGQSQDRRLLFDRQEQQFVWQFP